MLGSLGKFPCLPSLGGVNFWKTVFTLQLLNNDFLSSFLPYAFLHFAITDLARSTLLSVLVNLLYLLDIHIFALALHRVIFHIYPELLHCRLCGTTDLPTAPLASWAEHLCISRTPLFWSVRGDLKILGVEDLLGDRHLHTGCQSWLS